MSEEELLERYNNFYQYYSHEDFIKMMKNQENLIKYIEDKIEEYNHRYDIAKSKKQYELALSARLAYQDILERIKNNNYD